MPHQFPSMLIIDDVLGIFELRGHQSWRRRAVGSAASDIIPQVISCGDVVVCVKRYFVMTSIEQHRVSVEFRVKSGNPSRKLFKWHEFLSRSRSYNQPILSSRNFVSAHLVLIICQKWFDRLDQPPYLPDFVPVNWFIFLSSRVSSGDEDTTRLSR